MPDHRAGRFFTTETAGKPNLRFSFYLKGKFGGGRRRGHFRPGTSVDEIRGGGGGGNLGFQRQASGGAVLRTGEIRVQI